MTETVISEEPKEQTPADWPKVIMLLNRVRYAAGTKDDGVAFRYIIELAMDEAKSQAHAVNLSDESYP